MALVLDLIKVPIQALVLVLVRKCGSNAGSHSGSNEGAKTDSIEGFTLNLNLVSIPVLTLMLLSLVTLLLIQLLLPQKVTPPFQLLFQSLVI